MKIPAFETMETTGRGGGSVFGLSLLAGLCLASGLDCRAFGAATESGAVQQSRPLVMRMVDQNRNVPGPVAGELAASSDMPAQDEEFSAFDDPAQVEPWWGYPALCYDKNNPPKQEIIAEIERIVHRAVVNGYNQQGGRWPGAAGAPVTITWSFVPDGTNIPVAFNGDNGNVAGPSNLFARFDTQFGNRATWIGLFQECFNRWAALTGTTYTRIQVGGNPWDDGAAFPGSAGAAGARGDVRISGRNIDGGFGILAYNYFPTTGDMVVDTSDNYGGNTANNFLFLRNVLYHEHGHGLGMAHVCPTNGSKLMEPFVNTGFDGPQHDDLRGVMNLYGDAFEPNNSIAAATPLGTLAPGGSANPSTMPGPVAANGVVTGIDVSGDVDVFALSLTAGSPLNVTATPVGLNYDAATQNANGSCNSGAFFNSLVVSGLTVEVLSSGGGVLATNSAAAGASAQLTNVAIPTTGTYYVRVSGAPAPQSQLYNLTIGAGQIPGPSNDLCANAQFIDLGTITGSNIGATADGGDSCRGNANPDVWYRYFATCTGNLLIDTCGSALDTVVSVHPACPGTSANQIACNDDNGGAGPCPFGLTSYLSVPVVGGTTYTIRVAGFGGTRGPFTLNMSFQSVANDACASAIPVAPGNAYSGQICGALNDGTASCGASQSSRDVWYTYTPSCNHQLVLNTCGSNYDTVISVSTGTCGSLTEVACNDDAGSNGPCANTLQSYLSVPVTAGTQYTIRVAGFAGRTGNYVLNVGPVAQPNDTCAAATVVSNGTYIGGTCGATTDGTATCGSSNASPDVWYRWTAACSGNLVVTSCGSSYDTVLSVYTGACGALTQVGCNDDAGSNGRCPFTLQSYLSVPVTAGTSYFIRVSGFNGRSGSFVLDIDQQSNDRCANALPAGLGTTTFSTVCATNDTAGSCGASATSPDIWYSYTATCPRTILNSCTSAYDTVLSVYSGSCGSLAEVACNDDSGNNGPCTFTLQSYIRFNSNPGTTYYIRVSGFNGASGAGVINLTCGCIADVDDGSGSGTPDGGVGIEDLLYYLSIYDAGVVAADVDDGSGTGTRDGGVGIEDLLYYLSRYEAGC